ncbi:MAG: FHA domain-containing protein [Polyangiales bacterium]
MTVCARCRAKVVQTARFCSECGSWVVHEVSTGVVVSPEASTGLDPMTGKPRVAPPSPTEPMSPMTVETGLADAVTTLPTSLMPASPKKTAMRSVPPPAALVDKKAIVRTDVGRVSLPEVSARPPSVPPPPTTSSSEITGGGKSPLVLPNMAMPSAFDVPVSRAPRTIADATPRSELAAHGVSRAKRSLGAFLVSYQYEPLGAFWPLGQGANLVGRAGGRADVDVGLADITVSNEQAVIHVDPNHLGIEDKGSKNGTFVNGRPLIAGAKAPLRHGDRVRFGSFETVVVVVPNLAYAAGS